MAESEMSLSVEQTAKPRRRGLFAGILSTGEINWLRVLLANKVAVTSGIFVVIVILTALAAPLLAPAEPNQVDPMSRLRGPSVDHLLGTDSLGRDVLSRALYGARVSLLVGMSVTLGVCVLGSMIGLVAGYYQRLDTPIMRVMDGLMAFPSILLAIAIMASLGPRVINVIVALTVVYTPRMARLVRGMALSIRELPYVESARAIGSSDRSILLRYVFLNSLSPIIVQCTFLVSYAVLTEASLSFLGAGVPADMPTWGNMLQEGQRLITRAWWLSVVPGTALFLTVLTLTLFGDGLRDALDPRMRER